MDEKEKLQEAREKLEALVEKAKRITSLVKQRKIIDGIKRYERKIDKCFRQSKAEQLYMPVIIDKCIQQVNSNFVESLHEIEKENEVRQHLQDKADSEIESEESEG